MIENQLGVTLTNYGFFLQVETPLYFLKVYFNSLSTLLFILTYTRASVIKTGDLNHVFSCSTYPRKMVMAKMVFGRFMVSLKTRFKSLKMCKPVDDSYNQIEKSNSMRIEIRSRKARKLIEETLRVADSPKCTKAYSF
ncbi:hypothetical protein CTI12_AA413900 [Artemisia annua]|uniref:Uncharacterized protein n=1 Tax=Artemisia annua TaxID=35608 RepID=A0A2U1M6P1_ARTAN|nr:hypothetical protein CTI12_AA413900 [Artemisia annua]